MSRIEGVYVYRLDWDGSGRMETGECVGSSVNTVSIGAAAAETSGAEVFPANNGRLDK